MALNHHCAVFNVDYRLAPENKMPTGAMDFYKAVKYVIKNADKFKIDSRKVAIGGFSMGAKIAIVTAHELMKTGEENLVHSMWLRAPTVFHEMSKVPWSTLESYERPYKQMMDGFFDCCAVNLEAQ